MVREKVRDGAPWFVYSFQELIDELRPLENGQISNGEHVEQIEGYMNGKIPHHKPNSVHCNGINGFARSSLADGKEIKNGICSHESEALVD